MATSYGYVRVSTKEQNEDRQVIAMKEAGIQGRYIFMDKISGKNFNRPMYRHLLNRLQPNDGEDRVRIIRD